MPEASQRESEKEERSQRESEKKERGQRESEKEERAQRESKNEGGETDGVRRSGKKSKRASKRRRA